MTIWFDVKYKSVITEVTNTCVELEVAEDATIDTILALAKVKAKEIGPSKVTENSELISCTIEEPNILGIRYSDEDGNPSHDKYLSLRNVAHR